MMRLALTAALSLAAATATAQPPTYTVTEISSPMPYGLHAKALNNNGQVVGSFAVGRFIPQTGTPTHAFLFSDGIVRDLFPADSWSVSEANSINANGQIVGNRRPDGPIGPSEAFLYENGLPKALNPFGSGDLTGEAFGINDSGQIVGSAMTANFLHAFLLSPPPVTPAADLHPGGTQPDSSSRALAVNVAGQVVGTFTKWGTADNGYDTEDSFFWDGQGFRYPENLPDGAGFTPRAINASGQVAGFAGTDGQPRAVVYDGVGFTDQAGLPGSTTSRAYGINASGVVVGTSELADGTSRAVVWRDGLAYDINSLLASEPGLTLQEASAVSDGGQILAWGMTRVDQRNFLIRSFLLTPIANQPPTVNLEGPPEVGEGGSLPLTATATDPENEALTYEWDLDGDGTYETPSPDGSATFSAASLDGPETRTVGVRVTDPGGQEATATATVNILNVRPTAAFAISPSTVYVGEAATVSFTGPSDPAAADTAAGFSYAYDCTSDGSFEVPASANASHSCVYTLGGAQSARGRIEDRDGGFNDYTVTVNVRTLQQGVAGLIQIVRSFGLPKRTEKKLLDKLEHALASLQAGNVGAACAELRAFVKRAEDQSGKKRKKLTVAQANQIIAEAQAIRAALGCS